MPVISIQEKDTDEPMNHTVFSILAIAAFYLIEEHRAHLIASSGTILFVIFILLHLFMHSGHVGHGGHGGHGKSDEAHHEHTR